MKVACELVPVLNINWRNYAKDVLFAGFKKRRILFVYRPCFASWLKKDVYYMSNVLVSPHGLKNDKYYVSSCTGRNNVFLYFVNSTETGSCLYPSRFRPAETWWLDQFSFLGNRARYEFIELDMSTGLDLSIPSSMPLTFPGGQSKNCYRARWLIELGDLSSSVTYRARCFGSV